jgi:tetratricopeptide (TPR) repeat protein
MQYARILCFAAALASFCNSAAGAPDFIFGDKPSGKPETKKAPTKEKDPLKELVEEAKRLDEVATHQIAKRDFRGASETVEKVAGILAAIKGKVGSIDFDVEQLWIQEVQAIDSMEPSTQAAIVEAFSAYVECSKLFDSKYGEATKRLRGIVEQLEKHLGANSIFTDHFRLTLATACRKLMLFELRAQLADKCAAFRDAKGLKNSGSYADCRLIQAWSEISLGRFDAAEAHIHEALDVLRNTPNHNRANRRARLLLARVCVEQEHYEECVAALGRVARDAVTTATQFEPEDLAIMHFCFAKMQMIDSQYATAATGFEELRDLYRSASASKTFVYLDASQQLIVCLRYLDRENEAQKIAAEIDEIKRQVKHEADIVLTNAPDQLVK